MRHHPKLHGIKDGKHHARSGWWYTTMTFYAVVPTWLMPPLWVSTMTSSLVTTNSGSLCCLMTHDRRQTPEIYTSGFYFYDKKSNTYNAWFAYIVVVGTGDFFMARGIASSKLQMLLRGRFFSGCKWVSSCTSVTKYTIPWVLVPVNK